MTMAVTKQQHLTLKNWQIIVLFSELIQNFPSKIHIAAADRYPRSFWGSPTLKWLIQQENRDTHSSQRRLFDVNVLEHLKIILCLHTIDAPKFCQPKIFCHNNNNKKSYGNSRHAYMHQFLLINPFQILKRFCLYKPWTLQFELHHRIVFTFCILNKTIEQVPQSPCSAITAQELLWE